MKIEAKHSIGIIPITASKIFERMSYYGMRSIILLYMLNGQFDFPGQRMSWVYGIFTAVTTLFVVLGGLVSDLVLGIRLSTIIGLSIQATGCFLLAVPGIYTLYSGLLLISIGTGLFSPNIMSALNFTYQSKKKLMDAAFLILYAGTNAGALLGPLVIGMFGIVDLYWIGFLLAGFFSVVSLIIFLFTHKTLREVPVKPAIYYPQQHFSGKNEWRIISVVFILIALPAFWGLVQLTDNFIYDAAYKIEHELNVSGFSNFLFKINPVVIIVLGIGLSILWSYIYLPSFIKIVIGFAFLSISSFWLFATLSPIITDSMALFIVIGMILQAIAELFISASVISYICQKTSPRFNATLIAISTSSSIIFGTLLSFLTVYSRSIPSGILFITLAITGLLIGGLFFLFNFLSGKEPLKESAPTAMNTP